MLLLWVQLPRNLLLKLPDSTDTATNTGVPMMAVTSPVKSTPSSHPVNTLATEKSSSTPRPLCSMMLVGVTSRYAPMTLAQAWMAAAMSCLTSHSQQLWGIALLPNRRPKGWNTSA